MEGVLQELIQSMLKAAILYSTVTSLSKFLKIRNNE